MKTVDLICSVASSYFTTAATDSLSHVDNEHIIIRDLTQTNDGQLYRAFRKAFSDYTIPITTDEPTFKQKFIEKLQINRELSAGAFTGNDLVGFIFSAVNQFQGKKTMYNGGTGVVPEHRGKKLTIQMYHWLANRSRKVKAEQCALEVITTNLAALHAYEAVGFKKTRYFRCFQLHQKLRFQVPSYIELKPTRNPNWQKYHNMASFEPYFLDSYQHLPPVVHQNSIIEARVKGELAGYAIYESRSGRIAHLAVSPEHRRRKVGTALLHYISSDTKAPVLSVINIPREESITCSFLETKGFVNELNQFEMRWPL